MTIRTACATAVTATLALASLTACGESADQVAPETEAGGTAVAAETVTSVVSESANAPTNAADKAGAPAAAPAGELPQSVQGYSYAARAEMADEGVTESDVDAALAAAHNGEAEVEFDDGHWEIEWRDIDVDITPEGQVLEADR